MAERNEHMKNIYTARLSKWNASAAAWARRHRIALACVLVLLSLYTLLGFLLVPHLARNAIENYVGQELKRTMTIGDLTFNPFTLTTRVHRIALAERNGEPIASIDDLLVNLELSSIVHWALIFKEVRIDAPQVHLVIFADHSVNLIELMPKTKDKDTNSQRSAFPHIRIGSFAVHRGRLQFEDRTKEEPFAATLTPIEFALSDFRTEPRYENAYHLAAASSQGERFEWSGEFSVQPLGSTGRFTVTQLQATTIASYLQDAIPFDLRSGTLDVNGSYALKLQGGVDLEIKTPAITTQALALAARDDNGAEPWIAIPQAHINDLSFTLSERSLRVGAIAVTGVTANVWRDADGQLNLLRLLGKPAPAATTPVQPRTGDRPWQFSVDSVALSDTHVTAEDRSVQPVVHVNLSPITLTVKDFTTASNSAIKLDCDLGINEQGHLHASGDMRMQPFAASVSLDLADIDLTVLQPYIATRSDLTLTKGKLAAKTKLSFAAEPPSGQPRLKASGDLKVLDLESKDNALEETFIKWRELDVNGLDYTYAPDGLTIERIRAIKPYSRVIIASNRTINLKEVLKPARVQANETPTQAAKAATQQPMPMRIKTVVIEDGSANFADYSVKPSFATGIQALQGSIDGLSSSAKSRATVKLVGSVDRYAPVSITGEMNLLATTTYSDIAMDFRNMDLTTFNPYSGKYAGYDIAKGKLSTRLNYKIRDRALDAQHHIVVDQLEFGNHTDSKEAVSIPVKLAVSLLKDRNGVITLDLPVSGNLDDPEFKLGPIVWQVLVNLLTKAATSPFALLGSLFGGGDELAYVAFAPGSAELTAQESEKLGNLAHALGERPQLKLNVPVDSKDAADAQAYARQALDSALSAIAPKQMPADAEAASKQRLATLKALYKRALERAAPESAQEADLEKELLNRYTPTPLQLNELARRRAETVRDAIVSKNQIEPERIFFTAENEPAKVEGGAVRLELKLE